MSSRTFQKSLIVWDSNQFVNLNFSLCSSVWELVIVLEISKLLTSLYVEVSEKCHLYSVEYHEIGIRAHCHCQNNVTACPKLLNT